MHQTWWKGASGLEAWTNAWGLKCRLYVEKNISSIYNFDISNVQRSPFLNQYISVIPTQQLYFVAITKHSEGSRNMEEKHKQVVGTLKNTGKQKQTKNFQWIECRCIRF